MQSRCVTGLLAAAACGEPLVEEAEPLAVIVYTRENQWNHPANPIAARALRSLADEHGWQMTVTADPAVFTSARLARTDAIVFSLTSGIVLDESARAAVEAFARGGGGFVGTHSASSTEQDWPFYRALVPATFKTHPTDPAVRDARLTVESDHPVVAGVPTSWMRADEWYTFNERPEELGVDVLLALDEASLGAAYQETLGVGYHPLAWTHEASGGRVFYTALGHTPESYAEPAFLQMLAQGIIWTARR